MSEQDNRAQETRDVVVNEPDLSAATNRRLTEEVQAAVGEERVEVPADRPHPSAGEAVPRPRRLAPWAPSGYMIMMIITSGIVGGAILALITNEWWVLPLVFAVLAVMTAIVVAVTMGMTTNTERPSPSTVAAMEEEGIADPERHFTELVEEYAPDHGAEGHNERTSSAEAEPGKAAAEQRAAGTPASGPTRPVGPRRGGEHAQRQRRRSHT